MRRLVRLVARLCVVAVVGAVVLVWLAFQRAPSVASSADVSMDDIRRAKMLVVRNDPRRARAGAVRTISLSQQDATLLSQYAASRWRTARTRVTLRAGAASVQVSVATPSVPFGGWLNIDARLVDAEGAPQIENVWIGRVPVPGIVADAAVRWLLARLGPDAPMTMARDMVQRTTFTADSVRVSYRWRADATSRVRDLLIAPEDVARLAAYHARLGDVLTTAPKGVTLTLPQLFTPMFALAAARSVQGDAAAENRAALATLSLYVTGRSLGRWMPRARAWPKLPRRRVTLAGREDLTKHFLVSAIVAAEADRTLADAVGLTKEVDDSRGGSGFSFVDLAADRAGTRFGERAVGAPSVLQEALAGGAAESAFMPDISSLPESMTEGQLIARFGGVGGARYNAMIDTIERRIAAIPLLR